MGVDLQKLAAVASEGIQQAEQKYDDQEKQQALEQKTDELFEEYGEDMTNNFVDAGLSQEDAEALTNNAINYAATSLINRDGGEKDGVIDINEWATDDTYGYLGLDKDNEDDVKKMEAVFDNADLDGDGKLDEVELMTMYLYKDGVKDEKDLEKDELDFDGNVNVEDDDGHIAKNMQTLATDEGKEAAHKLANMAFGTEGYIRQVTKQVREAAMELTDYEPGDLDGFRAAKAQADEVADGMKHYLQSIVASKDPDKNEKITFDEWATDVTYSYLNLEKNDENKEILRQIYDSINIDGSEDGVDIKELASQFLYRDFNLNNMQKPFNGDAEGPENILRLLDTNDTLEDRRNAVLEFGIQFGIYDREKKAEEPEPEAEPVAAEPEAAPVAEEPQVDPAPAADPVEPAPAPAPTPTPNPTTDPEPLMPESEMRYKNLKTAQVDYLKNKLMKDLNAKLGKDFFELKDLDKEANKYVIDLALLDDGMTDAQKKEVVKWAVNELAKQQIEQGDKGDKDGELDINEYKEQYIALQKEIAYDVMEAYLKESGLSDAEVQEALDKEFGPNGTLAKEAEEYFAKLDTNGDQKLNIEELSKSFIDMDAADADGEDGNIDFDAIAKKYVEE